MGENSVPPSKQREPSVYALFTDYVTEPKTVEAGTAHVAHLADIALLCYARGRSMQ